MQNRYELSVKAKRKIKREILKAVPQLAGSRNRLRAAYRELKGDSSSNGEAIIQPTVVSGTNVGDKSQRSAIHPFANSVDPRVFAGGVGPKFEYAERIQKAPGKLEHFSLRTRSEDMRDVFARSATSLQYDYADVLRILRALRAGKLKNANVPKNWNRKLLLALARIVANQRLSYGDLEDAEVIFNAVKGIHGVKALGKTDFYIYAEVLTGLGRAGAAQRVFRDSPQGRKDPVQTALLTANARALVDDPNWDSWADSINTVFARDGLSPIKINPNSGKTPFDSIESTIEPRTVEGPLVTVFVPTYNRGSLIGTALKSLVQQTWKNLEIIVIDDGSDEEHLETLKEICAEYPEVKVIYQGTNKGAYEARNTALKVARGEFITVHDDDDWSHPEKIQVQVGHLMSTPDALGNIIYHARATEELAFTRINNNPVFNQPYFGSLMYRASVFTDFGDFDPINRSADAEFRDRVVAATGKPIPSVLNVPLAFIRAHSNSLTAGEISRGYIDPARTFYQSSYGYAFEDKDPDMPWGDVEFAHPLNMIDPNRKKDHGKFDVIFATDFAFPGGTSQLTLNEVEAAANQGMRVGMLLLASPLNAGKPAVTKRTTRVALHENVEVLTLDDRVTTPLLVVRHPSVLQFADSLSTNVHAEHLHIVVNHPPILNGGKGATYDLDDVKKNAVKLFGVEPHFHAESGVTFALASGVARKSALEETLWPGFTHEVDEELLHVPNFSTRPVLGRHSRNSALKWPSKLEELGKAYTSNEKFDVRIMGGISDLPKGAQHLLQEGAEVLDFDEIPVSEFLRDVDFWAYFHSEKLTESFGMSIVEAMAHGCLVVLPPYMEKNFGDGAVYGSPEEIESIVDRFWGEPELYREQVEKGRRKAEEMYSIDSFTERLRHYAQSDE